MFGLELLLRYEQINKQTHKAITQFCFALMLIDLPISTMPSNGEVLPGSGTARATAGRGEASGPSPVLGIGARVDCDCGLFTRCLGLVSSCNIAGLTGRTPTVCCCCC